MRSGPEDGNRPSFLTDFLCQVENKFCLPLHCLWSEGENAGNKDDAEVNYSVKHNVSCLCVACVVCGAEVCKLLLKLQRSKI